MAGTVRLFGQKLVLRSPKLSKLVALPSWSLNPSKPQPLTTYSYKTARVGLPACQLQKRRTLSIRCQAVATAVETAKASGSGAKEQNGAPERPTWKAAIDFRFIRDNVDAVEENARKRNAAADVRKVVALYEEFVKQTQVVDELRAERNQVANSLKGKMDPSKREELIAQGKQLREQLESLEDELNRLTDEMQREGQKVPNLTHPNVPVGGEELATIRKEVGKQRQFSFPVKDHVDLGEALGLLDFDSAAEVSGQKFYYLKNAAVLLEMALVNWALTKMVARGFTPLSTPDLVRSSVMEKCGFQPRAENTQVYSIEDSDLCLAGTAEILCGGLVMDRIIPEAELPIKLVAYSHCFRTEAGAAGRENRGLYRVHQFSKVELFVVSTPEQSDALHEELISVEEEMFAELGLHFKTLDMPAEDLGAPAYRKYDVEAWMPGLGKYGEISSASNCTDYQARRLNIRYKPAPKADAEEPQESQPNKGGKGKKGSPKKVPTQFVHTLNATACAVPRMIIAILENNQQEDGSVLIPEPLRPYMGGMDVIRPPLS